MALDDVKEIAIIKSLKTGLDPNLVLVCIMIMLFIYIDRNPKPREYLTPYAETRLSGFVNNERFINQNKMRFLL